MNDLKREQILFHEIPWWLTIVLFANIIGVIGFIWDVSWHYTIGRDTLFSLPHLVILFPAFVDFIIGVYLLFRATYFDSRLRAISLKFFGFYAPSGVWLFFLGHLSYLIGFVLDEWWHQNYGIDVQIYSVPHAFFYLGNTLFGGGSVFLFFSVFNSADKTLHKQLLLMLFIVAGFLPARGEAFNYEATYPNLMHNASFYNYFSVSIVYLVAAPRLLDFEGKKMILNWPATTIAVIDNFFMLAMQWLLPLFEAKPLVGPVYHPVDHYLPLTLHMILIPSGFMIDLMYKKFKNQNDWVLSFLLVTPAFAVFFIIQWFYGEFLLSAYSKNWFFGGNWHMYFVDPSQSWWNEFWIKDKDANGHFSLQIFLIGLMIAWLLSVLTARFTLMVTDFIKQIRR